MAPYSGFFTDILDALKTYIDTTYPTYRTFFGPISLAEFMNASEPAVSIQFNSGAEDTNTGRGWTMDISILYMKYDPSFTDDYDVIDDSETLMDSLETHLHAQDVADLDMAGDVVGVNTMRIPHDDSFIFAFEIKLRIWRIEEE